MGEKTYRIGEAADMLQLKSYVLRFWETEFVQLAPLRTDKGQRLYTETHLELLRRIRHLLHERGMTIDGARRILEAERRGVFLPEGGAPGAVTGVDCGGAAERVNPELLRELREELLALRELLLR